GHRPGIGVAGRATGAHRWLNLKYNAAVPGLIYAPAPRRWLGPPADSLSHLSVACIGNLPRTSSKPPTATRLATPPARPPPRCRWSGYEYNPPHDQRAG